MNLFAEVLDSVPQPETVEGCYLNSEDGLFYCEKCHTPKQTKITIFGTEKTVWCMCSCETAAENSKNAAFRQQLENEEIERTRTSATKDNEFRHHTFANDNGRQPMISQCKAYADNFPEKLSSGNGLLIYGDIGTGKSYSAEAIANELIDQGYPVLVTSMSKIAEEVSATEWGEKGAYFSRLNRYQLIVIDDLGAERETEYMMEIIYRVVDERDRSGKPMVITTNFSWEQIKSPKNDEWARIISRILKKGYPLKFEGADQRKINHMEMRKKENEFYKGSVS